MIKLLDCTLRDGGWVNQFNFGNACMCNLVNTLSDALIEFVELGYLDEKNGSRFGKTMYGDMDAIADNYSDKTAGTQIKKIVMIDYGKFPSEKIPLKKDSYVDGIRVCFHKKNMKEAIDYAGEIGDKGYLLFLQPMAITKYSHEDMMELIQRMGQLNHVFALYMVDSFGCMDDVELCHRLDLANEQLKKEIHLGIHLHNNRNLALLNAQTACKWYHSKNIKRDLVIDASLSGLGKGSGNLVLEDFVSYLNAYEDKNYDRIRIRSFAENDIMPLRNEFTWGYSPIYELSAKYQTTPSYAKIICEDAGFSMNRLEVFLQNLPDDKRDSCDRVYVSDYIEHIRLNGERS